MSCSGQQEEHDRRHSDPNEGESTPTTNVALNDPAPEYIHISEIMNHLNRHLAKSSNMVWWKDMNGLIHAGAVVGSDGQNDLLVDLYHQFWVIPNTHHCSIEALWLNKQDILNIVFLTSYFSSFLPKWAPRRVTWVESTEPGAAWVKQFPTTISPSLYDHEKKDWSISVSYPPSYALWGSKNKVVSRANLRLDIQTDMVVQDNAVSNELRAKNKRLEEQVQELQRKLNALNQHTQKLQRERDSLHAKANQLSNEKASRHRRRTKLQQDFNRSLRREQTLQETLQTTKEQMQFALHTKNDTIEEHKSEIARLQERVHILDERNRELEREQIECSRLREEVNELKRQNAREFEKNSKLRDKYSKLKGSSVSLDSSFWKIDKTIKELKHIRDQVHSNATDIFDDDARFNNVEESRQYELLFKVFMFTYKHCEDKLKCIRDVMKLDDPCVRNPLMELLQENYEMYLGLEDVKTEYLKWVGLKENQFCSVEQEYLALDNIVSEYMTECAKLCWVIVLTTSPQLEVQPREHSVPRGLVQYNPTEFILFPRCLKPGTATVFVTQYLLPGIVSTDTEMWVSPLATPFVDFRVGRGSENENEKEMEVMTDGCVRHNSDEIIQDDVTPLGLHPMKIYKNEQYDDKPKDEAPATECRDDEMHEAWKTIEYKDRDEINAFVGDARFSCAVERLEEQFDTQKYAFWLDCEHCQTPLVDITRGYESEWPRCYTCCDDNPRCVVRVEARAEQIVHEDVKDEECIREVGANCILEASSVIEHLAAEDTKIDDASFYYKNRKKIDKCIGEGKFVDARNLLSVQFDSTQASFLLYCASCEQKIDELPYVDMTEWLDCQSCKVKCPVYQLRVEMYHNPSDGV